MDRLLSQNLVHSSLTELLRFVLNTKDQPVLDAISLYHYVKELRPIEGLPNTLLKEKLE